MGFFFPVREEWRGTVSDCCALATGCMWVECRGHSDPLRLEELLSPDGWQNLSSPLGEIGGVGDWIAARWRILDNSPEGRCRWSVDEMAV